MSGEEIKGWQGVLYCSVGGKWQLQDEKKVSTTVTSTLACTHTYNTQKEPD